MNYPLLFLNYCATIDLKLTALRKSILFILWNAVKPLKAYEILDNLLQIKQNAKPPTVYRVLDFFVDYGVVHKIESIQSYTLCHQPQMRHTSEMLMVCNDCHHVYEIYDQAMRDLLQKLSQDNHFYLGHETIELRGNCNKCQSS